MKILLISNYLIDKQESMNRYSNIINQMLIDKGFYTKVVRPAAILGKIKKSNVGLGKWLGYVDKFVIFPIYLCFIKNKFDLIHICDHGYSLYTYFLKNDHCCVTCHDVFGIKSGLGLNDKNKRGKSGRLYQTEILKGLKRADKIITVSTKTKSDLLEISDIDKDRIQVIYNPLNYGYKILNNNDLNTKLEQYNLSNIPYVFHIGDDKWYKNRLGAIKIFEGIKEDETFKDLKFVLAGKPFNSEVKNHVQKSKYTSDIIKFDFVDNLKLEALYNGALLLLFPSFEEGFGWPIIESQSCGTPVVTSSRAPMTEVALDSAIYIDPNNHNEAVKVLVEVMKDPTLLKLKSNLGIKNTKRFMSEKISTEFIDLYKKSLKIGR